MKCKKSEFSLLNGQFKLVVWCIHWHKLSFYLHDRRFRCRLSGRSCRRSRCFSPHIHHCSDRAKRSCCSGRGSRPGLLGWSWLSPPGPGSHRWAAENGCIPGSLFVWMQSLLETKHFHFNTNDSFLEHKLVDNRGENGWMSGKSQCICIPVIDIVS